MRELQDLEKFEMETLSVLNQIKVLDKIYFGGGSMLRLCHNMNRYSTDLDFWIKHLDSYSPIYEKIYRAFTDAFTVKDAKEKANTLIFEIGSPMSIRNLVLEIRKDQFGFLWERKIAFSKLSRHQIALKGLRLEQMMKNKISALLSRKLIRDCFDVEFLLFRGVPLQVEKEELRDLIKIVEGFKERDFKVTLGSLLEEKDRVFCIENRFQFLREEIHRRFQLPSD
jgi:predicted nucleotidyltransferase component of viral defense system